MINVLDVKRKNCFDIVAAVNVISNITPKSEEVIFRGLQLFRPLTDTRKTVGSCSIIRHMDRLANINNQPRSKKKIKARVRLKMNQSTVIPLI